MTRPIVAHHRLMTPRLARNSDNSKENPNDLALTCRRNVVVVVGGHLHAAWTRACVNETSKQPSTNRPGRPLRRVLVHGFRCTNTTTSSRSRPQRRRPQSSTFQDSEFVGSCSSVVRESFGHVFQMFGARGETFHPTCYVRLDNQPRLSNFDACLQDQRWQTVTGNIQGCKRKLNGSTSGFQRQYGIVWTPICRNI